jgi:hypothetical protein
MERRSFLKSLAAALSAASVPGVSGAVVSHANATVAVVPAPDLQGLMVRTVNVRQESPLTFFADGTAIPDGKESAEVDVEAYFDNNTSPLLIDAYRSREAFELSLPIFRHIGVADQQWVISHYTIEASASSLILIRFTLRPANGVLKIAAPTNEEVNAMKITPRSGA